MEALNEADKNHISEFLKGIKQGMLEKVDLSLGILSKRSLRIIKKCVNYMSESP
jgi:hypothetical protein